MKFAILDPLRGLAALWVFAFHFQFSDRFQASFPLIHTIFKAGYLGVPMFFVISGYCLTASARSTIRKQESTKGFIYRRSLRIYPPYWCSIVVVASVPFLIEFFSSLRTGQYAPPSSELLNNGYMRFTILEWLRFATLTQVFASVPGATNLEYKFTTLNAVYWTLAIEFQFYLLVTLALILRQYFYAVLFLTTLISIPFCMIPGANLIGLCLPYWPMFALGILMFWTQEHGISLDAIVGKRATGVAILAIAGSIVWFGLATKNGVHWDPLWFAIPFTLVLWCARVWDQRFVTLTSTKHVLLRPVVSLLLILGSMSYSLYLLHGRLQFLVEQFVRQVFPAETFGHDGGVIIVTCALCYAFYRLCEAPFCRSCLGKSLPGAASDGQNSAVVAREPQRRRTSQSSRAVTMRGIAGVMYSIHRGSGLLFSVLTRAFSPTFNGSSDKTEKLRPDPGTLLQ
jgi:peptidoglycan/LPS O-acetylase OafA/YrhL